MNEGVKEHTAPHFRLLEVHHTHHSGALSKSLSYSLSTSMRAWCRHWSGATANLLHGSQTPGLSRLILPWTAVRLVWKMPVTRPHSPSPWEVFCGLSIATRWSPSPIFCPQILLTLPLWIQVPPFFLLFTLFSVAKMPSPSCFLWL